jgi:DNA-binding NarL/FixJ family response regulator
VPPWLKEAGLCEALTERSRTPIQLKSATYAAVRSGQGVLLRITADTASSAVCGAPHTAEFERELIQERIRSGIAAAKARGKRLGRQLGQRPKSDRLAPKVLALIKQGRSYRLIGREVGLSKNTVAEIVKRSRLPQPTAAGSP